MKFAAAVLACAMWMGVSSHALAHERDATRRVLVSVEGSRIDVVVTYELPPGQLATRLRAMVDRNGNGAIEAGWERLSGLQVLLPRVREDLELVMDGRSVDLELVELRFPPPRSEGVRVGIGVVALFRTPFAVRRTTELEVRAPGASVELQTDAAFEVVETTLPRRQGDPVLGPVRLTGDHRASVRLRRRDGG